MLIPKVLQFMDKPLTKSMIALLKEVEKRELFNEEPCFATASKSVPPLIARKFLTTKDYKRGDKNLTCLYLTQQGRDYLKTHG